MRSERERLLDIQEAIERIEKYAALGRLRFEGDELIQNWIVRHLQIIGEAVRSLPSHFREKYPGIPWTNIIGMRNTLVHDYFCIVREIVWSVVERELPALKREIASIVQELDSI